MKVSSLGVDGGVRLRWIVKTPRAISSGRSSTSRKNIRPIHTVRAIGRGQSRFSRKRPREHHRGRKREHQDASAIESRRDSTVPAARCRESIAHPEIVVHGDDNRRDHGRYVKGSWSFGTRSCHHGDGDDSFVRPRNILTASFHCLGRSRLEMCPAPGMTASSAFGIPLTSVSAKGRGVVMVSSSPTTTSVGTRIEETRRGRGDHATRRALSR